MVKQEKTRFHFETVIFAITPSFSLILVSVLFVYGRAIGVVSPLATTRLLLILWSILLILISVTYKLFKNWPVTGLISTCITGGFFLPEELFFSLLLVEAITFGLMLVIYILLKRKLDIKHVIGLTHIVIGLTFTIMTFQFIRFYQSVNWNNYQTALSNNRSNLPVSTISPSEKPDIYFIILDAYGRADILQEYYDLDNSKFIGFLKDEGFIVPINANTNYPYTALSIPSTLNFDYIQNISAGADESLFWWLMQPYIRESRTQLFLKNNGYTLYSIGTDWDVTNNTKADRFYSSRKIRMNEFEGYYLSVTPLKFIKPFINGLSDYDLHRETVLYNFQALAEIAKEPGPKFVFAHIIAPHPPFVFDSDGISIDPEYIFTFEDGNGFPGTREEYQTGYAEQVLYINSLLESAIKQILSLSEKPPIIIIQGDHGPRMLASNSNSQNICIRERFSIFAAYYLPGLDKDQIKDDFTPINLFRIILNQYFNTNMDLLENHEFLPNDSVYIYTYDNVDLDLAERCVPHP